MCIDAPFTMFKKKKKEPYVNRRRDEERMLAILLIQKGILLDVVVFPFNPCTQWQRQDISMSLRPAYQHNELQVSESYIGKYCLKQMQTNKL